MSNVSNFFCLAISLWLCVFETDLFTPVPPFLWNLSLGGAGSPDSWSPLLGTPEASKNDGNENVLYFTSSLCVALLQHIVCLIYSKTQQQSSANIYVLWLHWDLVQKGFHNNYLSVLLGLHFFYLNAMKHVHCDDLVVGCDSSYKNQWWNSDGQTSIRLQHCAAVDTISIYELQDTCTQISTKVKNNITC